MIRKKISSKTIFAIISIIFSLYIVSYLFLSMTGKYVEIEDMHGRKYATWQSTFCGQYGKRRNLDTLHLTYIGGFYLPLIMLDQQYFHSTILTYSAQGDGFRVANISENGKGIEQIDSANGESAGTPSP